MKIGEFSQLTGIPIKTIRYYCDINLVSPRYNFGSSYRHFGIEQLIEINRIIALKQSGFTLKEITSMSEDELSDEAMLRILKTKLLAARTEQKQANAKVLYLKQKIKNLEMKKEIDMKDTKFKVPPFQDTLLGVIKAVSTYYNFGHSDAMLFGGSGQAFLINIHDELCPSGPYVWNHKPFFKLLENLGISMTDHGMFSEKNTKEEIRAVEKNIISLMDKDHPCALVNLENQLILDCDDTGFILSQPWGDDFPAGRVTFTTWDEFNDDKFACFYSFDTKEQADKKKIFADSLEYALDLNQNSKEHTFPNYTAGIKAYDAFIKAVEEGHGSEHGNMWNASVWAECRKMASDYFLEMKDACEGIDKLCVSLSNDYMLISEGLNKAADRSVPIKPKVELLKEIKATEEDALAKIKELLKIIK